MTIHSLKKEMQELHSLIYREDCFGVRDMIRYEQIGSELVKRGYQIFNDEKLVIQKEVK